MSLDQDQVSDFARNYTDAWCSGDPTRVAAHFAPGGTIAINGGSPTEVTEVARSFMSTFPDLHLLMDDVVVKDESVEFHWTCIGTNPRTPTFRLTRGRCRDTLGSAIDL